MTFSQAIFLFFAGIVGGVLNAVAGGGSFIGFPALLFTGVPPIAANATNSVALWIGIVASGGAYRRRLSMPMRVIIPLLVMGFIGGIVGAVLLLKTPPYTFMRVVPWLMLAATLLFVFGKKLSGNGLASISHEATKAAIAGASIFELFVAVYGGYFGGGLGIVNLAMLAALGMADIHAMNALKSVLGSMINGVAVLAFVIARAIYWPQALVTTAGAVVGGYFGAHYAQKLPQSWIRGFVIVVGAAMTVYFFAKAY